MSVFTVFVIIQGTFRCTAPQVRTFNFLPPHVFREAPAYAVEGTSVILSNDKSGRDFSNDKTFGTTEEHRTILV